MGNPEARRRPALFLRPFKAKMFRCAARAGGSFFAACPAKPEFPRERQCIEISNKTMFDISKIYCKRKTIMKSGVMKSGVLNLGSRAVIMCAAAASCAAFAQEAEYVDLYYNADYNISGWGDSRYM